MKSKLATIKNQNDLSDNELDVSRLFCTLWRGKKWIIGCAGLFILATLIYSALVRQQWSTTAITDIPSVSMLGQYYVEQQFLKKIGNNESHLADSSTLPIMNTTMSSVYAEFIAQLGSYDTIRAFWLQSTYYHKRETNNTSKDAVLLDNLINNIQFTPKDNNKNLNDSIKLTAETAADANQLLRQYVNFANKRAVAYLNNELVGMWQAKSDGIQSDIEQQKVIALSTFAQKQSMLQNALKIAEQQNITKPQIGSLNSNLPDSALFLLGVPVLQAKLTELENSGPSFNNDYVREQEMNKQLSNKPDTHLLFQTYRYLRTPEEPVKRDSPRTLFLMILWGSIGALIGAGYALVKRTK